MRRDNMKTTRYILDLPPWEFFPTLERYCLDVKAAATRFNDGGLMPVSTSGLLAAYRPVGDRFSLVRDGRTVFQMDCVALCKDGAVVDIYNGLTGPRAGDRSIFDPSSSTRARVELGPEGDDLSSDRLSPEFPIIDGAALFEFLEYAVDMRFNQEHLGMQSRRTPYEDGTVTVSRNGRDWDVTMGEVVRSAGKPGVTGKYSYDDVATAARMVPLLDTCKAPDTREGAVAALTDALEKAVDQREAELIGRCRLEPFINEDFRKILTDERWFMRSMLDLHCLEDGDIDGSRRLDAGSADGYAVSIVRREGSDHKHVVLRDGNGIVSYQNAVRRDPSVAGILDRVLRKAERRKKAADLFKKLSGPRKADSLKIR